MVTWDLTDELAVFSADESVQTEVTSDFIMVMWEKTDEWSVFSADLGVQTEVTREIVEKNCDPGMLMRSTASDLSLRSLR